MGPSELCARRKTTYVVSTRSILGLLLKSPNSRRESSAHRRLGARETPLRKRAVKDARRKTQDTDVGNLAVALSDHDLLPEHRNAPYPIVPSMRSSPSTPLKETKASDLRNHHIKSRCNGGIRSCAPTSSDLLAAPNARCWQLTGSSFALCASSPPFRFHAGGSCMGHRRHRMQSFGVISVM